MADEDIDLVSALTSGDDLLVMFFMLLWKKSNGRGTSHELTGIKIPDSVVLHHSRPIHWFFTNKEGAIRMKSRRNLTTDTILSTLSARKGRSISGCAVQYVTQSDKHPDGVALNFCRPADMAGFVNSNGSSGVLQRFVDPKPDRGTIVNTEIVVNWTPNIMVMERRFNENALAAPTTAVPSSPSSALGKDSDDSNKELYNRCTVAEGDKYVHTAAVVSSHTTSMVEATASHIATHISIVFGVRVSSMSLHLKISPDDEVYVLRCSALRCADLASGRVVVATLSKHISSPKRADAGHGHQPHSNDLVSEASTSSTSPTKRRLAKSLANGQTASADYAPVPCVMCDAQMSSGEGHRIARRHVLFPVAVARFLSDCAEHRRYGANDIFVDPDDTWADGDEVPVHAKLTDRALTAERYGIVRRDEGWLSEPLVLCAACADSVAAVASRIHVDADGMIRAERPRPVPLSMTQRKSPSDQEGAESPPKPRRAAVSPPPPPATRQSTVVTLPPLSKTPTKRR